MAGICRSETYDKIHSGGEFTKLGGCQRFERDGDHFLELWIATSDSPVEKVLSVLFFSCDVELGCENSLSAVSDRVMNVRGPPRIRGRPDGAKMVTALGVRGPDYRRAIFQRVRCGGGCLLYP